MTSNGSIKKEIKNRMKNLFLGFTVIYVGGVILALICGHYTAVLGCLGPALCLYLWYVIGDENEH